MNAANSPHWKPSPELLAAFADGELDSRDDAALLRTRVEAWLAANPEAQADLTANRRLKALWDRTSPPLPPDATWRDVLNRFEPLPAPEPAHRAPKGTWLVGAGAAAACLLWVFLLASSYWKTPPVEVAEVFAIASESDIEILHIEGDAIDSLIVGLLPFQGVLELADLGEIDVMSVTGAPRDNMKPVIDSDGPHRPLIWARLDWEEE